MQRNASAQWVETTSRKNALGESESWHLEIPGLIMIGLDYRAGKWQVTSGTLAWFPKAVLKATTLAEAKPAAVRVVQGFLKKNLAALEPLNK